MIIKLGNKDVKLPDFLIIGAAKSGTSSLYHYLRQHPQIFMPNHKEPCFFTFAGKRPTDLQSNTGLKVIDDFDQYVSLFEFSSCSQKLGEASTCYLYHYDKTIRTIKKYHRRWQDLRIIIALRNPIQRAYSHYLNHVRDGLETSSFRDLVKRHQVGKNLKASPYIPYGFYFNQVAAYLTDFKNVKVYLFEELEENVEALVSDLLRFIEVDCNVYIDTKLKSNVSGIPKNRSIVKFLQQRNPVKELVRPFLPKLFRLKAKAKLLNRFLYKPQLDSETRATLKQIYVDDVLRLQDLINRDLSSWLN